MKKKTPPCKVIIIGATSGIGREIAKIYAKRGDMIGATGRRTDLLLSLQREFPKNIIIEAFDVTGNENIIHLRSLIEKLDGVDIIIYNSGYGDVSRELDYDLQKKTTDVNVNGFLEIITYGFNYLKNQDNGRLVAISSIASIRGNPSAPAYSASKAYMSNYMEGLFLKARKMRSNILVIDIQPGFVDTGMAKGGKFWIAPAEKAAVQIVDAIDKKKRRAYITKRWAIIAWLLKQMPFFVFKRIL